MLLSRQAAQAMLLELEQGTDTGGTETRSHFSDFGKKKKTTYITAYNFIVGFLCNLYQRNS